MSQKMIHIEGIGAVLLEHSRRVKYIQLSVKPFKGIRVAVPLRTSLDHGESAARARIPWLRKHAARIAAVEKQAVEFARVDDTRPQDAGRTILQRVRELAAGGGFTPAGITIRNQRTRWGSCSTRNRLNLNIRLVHLPPPLMDYVILHELVHTRVRNHGSAFWQELARHIDSPKQRDHALKRYGFLLAR